MRPPLRIACLAAASCMVVLAGCAVIDRSFDEVLRASLDGQQEVPPVTTPAGGAAEVRYSPRTQLLQWSVAYQGLSGPVTGAHLHGPAGPGQNAPIVVPFGGNLNAPPIRGQLRLTPEQAGQLQSGQWYVNLHTARHPQGEIRGQLRR